VIEKGRGALFRRDLEWGYIIERGNEVHIVTTIDDPPALFLASMPGTGSKGTVAWGSVRPDGTIEGMVLMQGKQDERYRDDPSNLTAEATVHVRWHRPGLSDDAQMVPVLELRHDGVRVRGPVTFFSP